MCRPCAAVAGAPAEAQVSGDDPSAQSGQF
jgi:hypothetical protein